MYAHKKSRRSDQSQIDFYGKCLTAVVSLLVLFPAKNAATRNGSDLTDVVQDSCVSQIADDAKMIESCTKSSAGKCESVSMHGICPAGGKIRIESECRLIHGRPSFSAYFQFKGTPRKTAFHGPKTPIQATNIRPPFRFGTWTRRPYRTIATIASNGLPQGRSPILAIAFDAWTTR